MVTKINAKTVLILLLLVSKTVFGQETKCDFFRLLHYDDKNRLDYFDNDAVRVFLKNDRTFEVQFSDSSAHLFSQANEIKVRPADAAAYSIRIEGGHLLAVDNQQTIDFNKGLDTFSNIKADQPFTSSWKIGKTSFLDATYEEGKAVGVDILELKRKISLWISYSNNLPQITKVKISWLDSGNYLVLSYSGNNYPYLFNYYDALKKGGVAVFFKFRKNYLSNAMVYLSPSNVSNVNQNSMTKDSSDFSKAGNQVFIIPYDRNGMISEKTKKKFGCN